MEYVFGSITRGGRAVEIVKTIGDKHTALSGFCQVIREYPDQTISDSFRVTRHYNSDEDVAGNCYDWYEIANHWRDTDKTGPVREAQSDTDALLVDQELRITLLELFFPAGGGEE